MASSSTKKILWGAIGLLIVFAGGLGLAKSMGWLGSGKQEIAVESTEAKLKTITQVVSASGRIQPELEVIIRPDVSGEIIELNVQEGDFVKEGDLLLRIKPDIYQAKIDELNAMLLTQKSRLEQSKAQLIQAKAQFDQQKQLYDKELISEMAFIQARSEYESQEANLKAAKYQVESAEAQLRRAKEELQQTVIRAPREGTISKLSVEQGERVLGNTQMTGTELMRIARMDQMEVMVEVNENDIVNVAANDSALIEVDAYPERQFDGVVTEIANSAEVTGQGTQEQVTNYQVKVRIKTPHNLSMAGSNAIQRRSTPEAPGGTFVPTFKPGMSATVDIQTETVKNVVAVPIQAVTVRDFAKDKPKKSDQKSESEVASDSTTSETDDALIIPKEDLRKVVFVVENGKAVRHEVKTGISDNTHIQVLEGVNAGDKVVIGSYRTLSKTLADGDLVKEQKSSLALASETR
jgi:HlyD family secretion protein